MDETNIRSDIVKLPEENIKKKLFDIHFGIEFFGYYTKSKSNRRGFKTAA